MIEQKFKVLMVNGEYVDETLLGKGIYYTNKPTLLNKDMTIKSLVQSQDANKGFCRGGDVARRILYQPEIVRTC